MGLGGISFTQVLLLLVILGAIVVPGWLRKRNDGSSVTVPLARILTAAAVIGLLTESLLSIFYQWGFGVPFFVTSLAGVLAVAVVAVVCLRVFGRAGSLVALIVGYYVQDLSITSAYWIFYDGFSAAEWFSSEQLRFLTEVFFESPFRAATTAAVVATVYFQTSSETVSSARATGTHGYGGIDMSTQPSEPTRLVVAETLLGSSALRAKVVNEARDPNRFQIYDPTIDQELVLLAARSALSRDHRFWLLLAAIWLVVIVLLAPTAGGSVILGGLAGGLAYLFKCVSDRVRFTKLLALGSFNPDEVREELAPNRLESTDRLPSRDQNVLVYQGFSPFQPLGHDYGGWSFTIDLTRPKQSLLDEGKTVPDEIDVTELYETVAETLSSLTLEGFSIDDCLMIPGSDIPRGDPFLPDKFAAPADVVDPDIVAEYVDKNDSRVRHYKRIRIVQWAGELNLALFLRFTRAGPNLFVELSRVLTTPVNDRFRKIDEVALIGFSQKLAWGIWKVIVGIGYTIFAPFLLFGLVIEKIVRAFEVDKRRRNKEIRENPKFNYGARQSFRFNVSSSEYVNYFQKMDSVMSQKVLEQQLLDTIVDILDRNGVDTSEIKERQSTILNSGIIVQNGDVSAGTLAVGTKAKAQTRQSLGQRLTSLAQPKAAAGGQR